MIYVNHTVNGRRNINSEDVAFFVKGLGFTMNQYWSIYNGEETKFEIVKKCYERLKTLDVTQLKLVDNLISSISQSP